MTYISMDTVMRINREKGKHFFSPDTTRFFRSRYAKIAYGTEDGKQAFFVTSEQFDNNSPRLFTVRKMDMETGYIDSVGEFQEYRTRYKANRDAKRLAETFEKGQETHGE